MKALILSGGGAKGAFTGGMIEYMKMVMGKDYDLYIGTSTGSLLQTLASINDFKTLKEAYTTINLEDIYKISPFKKSKNPEETDINIFNAFRMHFLEKQPTLGDSSNLLKTIERFFPEDKFNKSLRNNKKIITCVTNISKARNEYFASTDITYKEFCDWTWISCNAVPFTSLVRRGLDNDYYADGGFMEHLPICKAIEEGATEIDAFSTSPETYDISEEIEIGGNPLTLIGRLFDLLLLESSERDIERAKAMAKEKNIKLNVYYVPRKLTKNPMYFDKEIMNKWWEEGFNYMKEADINKIKVARVINLRKKS